MKIGIVTDYYYNRNYGGLLQSYALTQILNAFSDTIAEQIQIQAGIFAPKSKAISDRIKKALNPAYFVRCFLIILGNIIKLNRLKKTFKNINLRNLAFLQFQQSIPHSPNVFFTDNISDCGSDYNLFITGSDQVWNYSWYKSFNFLDFTIAPKISYAASIGNSSIPDEWIEKYREHLKYFTAISVREEEAVAMIQPLSPVPVEWVLDPTLLLSASEWDEICSPRQVDEPYMFCYFLGGCKRDRIVAEEVANKKNLRIVTLPHLLGAYRSVDKQFGDIQLWDVGPKEFISLIKFADFVLTDSFHGSVFSTIYHRPFAAFEREGAKGMGGRLKSLTDLTDTQDRFLIIPEMANADYICALPSNLPEETDKMRMMREKSMNYLKRNIEAVRQKQEKDNA